jgi:hypothetical protein
MSEMEAAIAMDNDATLLLVLFFYLYQLFSGFRKRRVEGDAYQTASQHCSRKNVRGTNKPSTTAPAHKQRDLASQQCVDIAGRIIPIRKGTIQLKLKDAPERE